MNVYIYNENMTNQSIRQMITILSYIKCDELYLDFKWQNRISRDISVKFLRLDDFLKLRKRKAIIFFNIIDGYKLIKYKNRRDLILVFRPRGIVPEETYYKNRNIFKKLALDFIERKVIKSTDFFVFLNKAQKQHFEDKYPKNKTKMETSPLLSNIKEMNSRKVPFMDKNTIRIVYSGGFSKWQKIDLVFSIASKIINELDVDSVFTVLTFDHNFQEAKNLVIKYGISANTAIKYVEPDNLDEELIKHDIGILIRDNNIVNKTASPFKLVDYIYNGLGLIITDNLLNQVKNIVDETYYFPVLFDKENVIYSSETLKSFLIYFKNQIKRTDVINSYNNYILGIEKIDLEKLTEVSR